MYLFFLAFLMGSTSANGAVPMRAAETLRLRLEKELRAQMVGVERIEVPELRLPASVPPDAKLRLLSPAPTSGLVSYEVDDGQNAPIRGVTSVRAFGPVVVATRNLRAGERLDASNVQVRVQDLSVVGRSPYYRTLSELGDLRLRAPIGWGSAVRGDSTEPMPVVNPGQLCDLVRERGALRVSLKVRALEGGAVSKWIRVENPNSRKVFMARITGQGAVTQ